MRVALVMGCTLSREEEHSRGSRVRKVGVAIELYALHVDVIMNHYKYQIMNKKK